MAAPNNKVGKLHLDKSFVNKLEILYKDKKKKNIPDNTNHPPRYDTLFPHPIIPIQTQGRNVPFLPDAPNGRPKVDLGPTIPIVPPPSQPANPYVPQVATPCPLPFSPQRQVFPIDLNNNLIDNLIHITIHKQIIEMRKQLQRNESPQKIYTESYDNKSYKYMIELIKPLLLGIGIGIGIGISKKSFVRFST